MIYRVAISIIGHKVGEIANKEKKALADLKINLIQIRASIYNENSFSPSTVNGIKSA